MGIALLLPGLHTPYGVHFVHQDSRQPRKPRDLLVSVQDLHMIYPQWHMDPSWAGRKLISLLVPGVRSI
jgi:hypothetical protein